MAISPPYSTASSSSCYPLNGTVTSASLSGEGVSQETSIQKELNRPQNLQFPVSEEEMLNAELTFLNHLTEYKYQHLTNKELQELIEKRSKECASSESGENSI